MAADARKRRGAAAARLALLEQLRPLLCARVDAERMVRSVAKLLAVEIGHYCITDVLDPHGAVRRLEIGHADPGRGMRLRVLCENAEPREAPRVTRLLSTGGSEIIARVAERARSRVLSDIVVLPGEEIRSYMAATVLASGAPIALFSLVTTTKRRRYADDDLPFLRGVAEWVGLGLENALRREHEPRRSLLPASEEPGGWSDESPSSVRTPPLRR